MGFYIRKAFSIVYHLLKSIEHKIQLLFAEPLAYVSHDSAFFFVKAVSKSGIT